MKRAVYNESKWELFYTLFFRTNQGDYNLRDIAYGYPKESFTDKMNCMVEFESMIEKLNKGQIDEFDLFDDADEDTRLKSIYFYEVLKHKDTGKFDVNCLSKYEFS